MQVCNKVQGYGTIKMWLGVGGSETRTYAAAYENKEQRSDGPGFCLAGGMARRQVSRRTGVALQKLPQTMASCDEDS